MIDLDKIGMKVYECSSMLKPGDMYIITPRQLLKKNKAGKFYLLSLFESSGPKLVIKMLKIDDRTYQMFCLLTKEKCSEHIFVTIGPRSNTALLVFTPNDRS